MWVRSKAISSSELSPSGLEIHVLRGARPVPSVLSLESSDSLQETFQGQDQGNKQMPLVMLSMVSYLPFIICVNINLKIRLFCPISPNCCAQQFALS